MRAVNADFIGGLLAQAQAAIDAEALAKAAKRSAGVASALIEQTPDKSISSTAVLPEPTVPPAAPTHQGTPVPPSLVSLPSVQFDGTTATAARQVEAQTASAPPPTGNASGLLASMAKAQQATEKSQAATVESASNVILFSDEKAARAIIRAEAEALYRKISKRYIKFTGDGPPKAFNKETGEYMSRDSFFEFLKDSPEFGVVDIGTEERPKLVSCGEPWWNWTFDHKFAADRIVMEPTNLTREEELTSWALTPSHRTYNRWHDLIQGRVKPDMTATLEDIAPLTDHLLMISGQEPLAVEHFMCQMAQIYQFPQHKLRTGNFWYSLNNYVGKSMMIDLLKPVFGPSPLVDECEGASLGGQFTALLKDGLIRMFNEVPIMDAARFDVTKTLMSEKTRKSEDKQKDAKPVKNFLNLILTSNNLQALPLAMGCPRFNIFRYDGQRMPPEYYKTLGEWIAGPGPALFAGVLANWVFPDDWDVVNGGRLAPQTSTALAMQREARADLINFLEGLIDSRAAPFDRPIGRPGQVVEQLGLLYPTNCRAMKVSARTVAEALRKLGATIIGSGTASKDKAMCWRNQQKWAAVRLKEWKAYLDDNALCPVPEEEDDHE